MASNRFYGKAKYVPETEYYDDDATQMDSPPSNDATQMDSPPSNKRPNLEEYTTDILCSSQDVFTEQQEPNSQKWISYSEQMGECNKKEMGTMTDDMSTKDKYIEVDTMTEPGLTCSNNPNMEMRCNEYFGSIVACELANYHGSARYNKMKEIIDIFKEK